MSPWSWILFAAIIAASLVLKERGVKDSTRAAIMGLFLVVFLALAGPSMVSLLCCAFIFLLNLYLWDEKH